MRANEYDTIFKKGDTPDNAYYIIKGKVKFVNYNENEEGETEEVVVNEYLKGRIFGELQFLRDSQ